MTDEHKEEKQEADWIKRRRAFPRRQTKLITVSMTEPDLEILEWLMEFLGTSRAEAARTAIRSFAAQMKGIRTELGRPPKDG